MSNRSNVLFGPGATGIVGAPGGGTHAVKDIVATKVATICGCKRFMCSKLILQLRFLSRQSISVHRASATRFHVFLDYVPWAPTEPSQPLRNWNGMKQRIEDLLGPCPG